MSKLTRTYDLYEIVKVPFPFTDTKKSKVRPALILSSARHFNAQIGMSLMAMVTSEKLNQNLWPTDIVIKQLGLTGLPFPSIIRFKLFTLDHDLILGRLGKLADADQQAVRKKLKEIFDL